MKGVIALCLKDMVVSKHGQNTWENILGDAGEPVNLQITAHQDIEDPRLMKIVYSVGRVLEITPEQVADAFGEHWMSCYTQRFYRRFFDGVTNAKQFILNLDMVHKKSTVTIPDARPPRFEYELPDENTIILTYKSERGMWDLFHGLLKAVGKFYNEELVFEKVGENKMKIGFPPE